MEKYHFFLVFLTFGIVHTVSGQNSDTLKEFDLEEVMVTATRTERQLSSIPLPSLIVGKKEIQQINSIRLNEILNEQTGLVTIPDFGGGEGIQLQGLDAEYTLILLDGVPMIGRSAGTLDLSRITVQNIKQIEVVKGASSSLYGSEALGGVINIITDKNQEGFQGNAHYRYGSFNTHDTSLGLDFQKQKTGIRFFINRLSSDGYDLVEEVEGNTVEPFANYTFTTDFNTNLGDKGNLLLSGRYYTQAQDLIFSTLSGESLVREWNTRAKIDYQISDKWSSYLDLYATNYFAEESLIDLANAESSSTRFDQLLFLPEFRTTFQPNARQSLILGVGWRHEYLERDNFSTNPTFNSQYIYFQYDTYLLNQLNLIIGSRFDNHSEYSSQFSPKIALQWDINNTWAVKASAGYGFKAPDFRQLYFDFFNSAVGYNVIGYNVVDTRLPELEQLGEIRRQVVSISEFDNPLKPESSINYNIGIQFSPTNRFSFNLNFFRNDIRNLIDTRVIANKLNGQNVFSYQNVDEVYTQGMEVDFSWQLLAHLKLKGGYQLLYAKDKAAEQSFEEGRANTQGFALSKQNYFGLFNRSRHLANFKIFYEVPNWSLNTNLRATYRSKYGLFDSNGNTYLDDLDEFVSGYCILDWALNKTFYQHYELGVGVDNLLDFTDAQNISNIPGRLLYAKFHVQF